MVEMEETQMVEMLTAVTTDVNSSLLIFDNALMLRSPEIEIVMDRLSAGLKVMTDYIDICLNSVFLVYRQCLIIRRTTTRAFAYFFIAS